MTFPAPRTSGHCHQFLHCTPENANAPAHLRRSVANPEHVCHRLLWRHCSQIMSLKIPSRSKERVWICARSHPFRAIRRQIAQDCPSLWTENAQGQIIGCVYRANANLSESYGVQAPAMVSFADAPARATRPLKRRNGLEPIEDKDLSSRQIEKENIIIALRPSPPPPPPPLPLPSNPPKHPQPSPAPPPPIRNPSPKKTFTSFSEAPGTILQGRNNGIFSYARERPRPCTTAVKQHLQRWRRCV